MQATLANNTITHDQASYTCKITPLIPNPSFYYKLRPVNSLSKLNYLEYLENSRIVVEGSIKSIKLGLA